MPTPPTKTTVVNLHRGDVYDVYIGRPSKWGSPFIVGVDGTRWEVIEMYEQYVRTSPDLLESLPELKGKVLGCFCKPLLCHGDILVKLVEEFCK